MVRMDFGRLRCYYRQPDIPNQFAYQRIYLVLIGNVAAEKHAPKDYSVDRRRAHNLQFGKMRLPDNDPAVVITSNRYAQPTTASGRWRAATNKPQTNGEP
jgi:hypothetical protein